MSRRIVTVVGALVVVALVAAAVVVVTRTRSKSVVAIFPQVVQMYVDDEVRVAGVKVGTITGIEPVPGGVKVEMSYDADAPVPDDAKAVIVAPTLLNRRYVQLTPPRAGGPRLPDGAVLGPDRTVVPVEYDQIKTQLNELATMLGPANGQVNGSLGRALSTTAANLRGNGGRLNDTVTNLARAIGTLSDGRDDLYGTVRNLNTVVGALRGADDDVNGFTRELATTSRVLADSSDDLHRSLDAVDSSLKRIGDFVRENRDPLGDNLRTLSRVSGNLAHNRQALADLLQRAPHALDNFQNIYDAFSGSISGALAANTDTDQLLLTGLLSTFLGTVPPVVPGATTALDVERNGSANYIEPRDGRCKPPDPHPRLQPPYDPARTPPKADNGGQGSQPYFAEPNKCHGPASSSSLAPLTSSSVNAPSAPSLAQLLVPAGGN